MFVENCFWSFWQNCFNYEGATTRKVYWTTRIFWWAVDIIFFIGLVKMNVGINNARMSILIQTYVLIIGLPMLALMQRRLNDTNMRHVYANTLIWAYVLAGLGAMFIPMLGTIYGVLATVIFVLCLLPTDTF